MFTDLETLRSDVKERLTPNLPTGWGVEETIEAASKVATPVLYIEFTTVSTTVRGEPLGRGQVSVGFNLIITDPKADTAKAENSVDGHLVKILRVLDEYSDFYWESAEKRRLASGVLAWAIAAFAFVSTTPTEED